MGFDFKEFIEAASRNTDAVPAYLGIEEDYRDKIARHIRHLDETWKSPLTLPKESKRLKDYSVIVLVRYEGEQGVRFDRYDFKQRCFYLANARDCKVTGWNYLTKGINDSIKAFLEEYGHLQVRDPEKWYLELFKFCKSTGFEYDP